MALSYSIDLISDLNLDKTTTFDWTGKPTSLFCVVAGNISPHIDKIREVLDHLGTVYRGVFYIDGNLDHTHLNLYEERIKEITEICRPIQNVIYMHNHVILVNEIAFVAVNGWFGKHLLNISKRELSKIVDLQNEDIAYLSNTVRNLQLHQDAKRIIIISNSVPSEYFLYNSINIDQITGVEPGLALIMDSGHKVTHWLYGGSELSNDITIDDRRYVNNPSIPGQPYWPKRILI